MSEIKKIIEKIYSDELTGIAVYQDVYGDLHIPSTASTPTTTVGEKKYLQSIVTTNWPGVDDFYKIPDYFNTGEYLDYLVPDITEYDVNSVVAGQNGNSLSIIGLFIDDTIRLVLPLRDSILYSMNNPIKITSGSTVSVRFRPSGKGTELSINVGGYLITI